MKAKVNLHKARKFTQGEKISQVMAFCCNHKRAHQSKRCILLALYSLMCIKANNLVILLHSVAALKHFSEESFKLRDGQSMYCQSSFSKALSRKHSV